MTMAFNKACSLVFSTGAKNMSVSRSICNAITPSISINGFGRIGKMLLRESLANNVKVIAVNQPFCDINDIANSLKFDSVHGPFDMDVTVIDPNTLCVSGNTVKVFHEQDPEKIKWNDFPSNYIVDATGKFTKTDEAKKHLKAGAKKVIITAPSKDAPTFVKGVNFADYNKSMVVVSNASCTTNCAAPLLKAFDELYGLVSCMFTTTHAMTASQHVHDGLKHRSGTDNIVPSTTGAAKAIDVVLPKLKGMVNGDAARVPVLDVSLLKLYINVKCSKNLSLDCVKEEIKRMADAENLKDVVHYVDNRGLASSDFVGCPYSAVVDLQQVQVIDKLIGLGVWYDNEVGYACRVLDLVKHMADVDSK